MRVAVRVDAGPLIGGGHAMRCLTLADALVGHGAETIFVTAAITEALAQHIAGSGHELVQIPASVELEREGQDWHEKPLSADGLAADVESTQAAVGNTDWLIADHYLLDERWHSAARAFAERILVIDDLANRQYDCDLLLDQTYGRSAADYRALVPEHGRILTGATYALLRPEFARERPAALERRRERGQVRRILVSLGTTDPNGITAAIVEQVAEAAPGCAVDVVLGPDAPSLPRVRELAASVGTLTLHVDTDRMPELMREADLSVGAAGATSWERCCLGLPTLTLILAGNQELTAKLLQEARATKLVSIDSLHHTVRAWIHDDDQRHTTAERAASICDGKGTERVLRTMIDEEEADDR